MATKSRVALVAGVGDGLGSAVARRFARAGYHTVLVARNIERLERIAGEIEREGGRGIAYVADIREETAVSKLFDDVEAEIGAISAVVFNAGANYRASILDTPADMFEKVWRLGCFAGFVVGREAAQRMAPRGEGTIIFTGATASVRGSAHYAAFAAAKGGLRQVAQSMARELGPQGIHVASIIIDGMIDTRRSVSVSRIVLPRLGKRACCNLPTSPMSTCISTISRGVPGRSRPTCGHGKKTSREALIKLSRAISVTIFFGELRGGRAPLFSDSLGADGNTHSTIVVYPVPPGCQGDSTYRVGARLGGQHAVCVARSD